MQLDLIVENARILTGDSFRPTATRLGVWNGVFVGVDERIEGMDAVVHVDARGQVITPGFNDVHAHSVWFGQSLLELDLDGQHTADAVYEAVSARAAELNPGTWVVCTGYNPDEIEGPEPERDGLDAAAQGRPVLLRHSHGHAYTVNSAVLFMAGIPEGTHRQPEGGEVVTDETGRPTGVLKETAMSYVNRLLQPESDESIAGALERASSVYAKEGLTSVTDAGVAGGWIGHSPLEFGAYQRARDAGMLKTRFQAMITLDALHEVSGHSDDGERVTLDAGLRTGLGDEWLQVGPTKIFADGSIMSRTAAMTQEYEHCHHVYGYLQQDRAHMRTSTLAAAAAGWSLALHALGDAAVDFAIEVIEEATLTYGRPRIPHRIEHGGVVRDDQIRDMARLGIVLATQPNFIAAFGEGEEERLGVERTKLSYPAKRLLDAGMVLPGSSDRPVTHGAPLRVMQDFVLRRSFAGRDFSPADRISAAEALHAYTVGSATATGWGGRKGQIRSGQLADFVVLGASPLEVPAEEIGDIEVVATAVGGAWVHGGL